MKIVLDICGGDNSPYAPIDGAIDFLMENVDKNVTIVLSGNEMLIKKYLADKEFLSDKIEIINAEDEITCHDEPTSAIVKKPESSMAKALKYVGDDKADAIVSSGSTGALYAGSVSRIKRIHGITRPALTPILPNQRGEHTLLIDSGANADCRPEYLAQFAVMGSAFMRAFFDIQKPRVGLINNGTEAEKGNLLSREAYMLISESDINFVGNLEARDVLTGKADVLVCDGFTGNVLLKTIEGSISAFSSILKEELKSGTISKVGALLIKDKILNIKKRFDYNEAGGALLLGINKCVIKAHGSSDARAYTNALMQAYNFIKCDAVGIITKAMEHND